MEPRGKRVALVTAALGVATVAVAIAVLWNPLAEEWHLYRLRTGGEEAKAAALDWIAKHGTERCMAPCVTAIPELLLQRRFGRGFIPENQGSIISAYGEERLRKVLKHDDLDDLFKSFKTVEIAETAMKGLMERLGRDRLGAVFRRILEGGQSSSRVRVYLARCYLVKGAEVLPGPDLHEAARRRLVEALSDPDPIVRGAACYGLAECGESAREAIPAIEALRKDPEALVRESAEYAVEKISGTQHQEEAVQ